jgi:hypothetical protein
MTIYFPRFFKNMVAITGSFFLFCIAIPSYAQQNGTISGTVQAPDKSSIAGASVSLYKTSDSSLVKITAAGGDGTFSFSSLRIANYFLRISAIGYVNYSSSAIVITAEQANYALPVIVLSRAVAGDLGGVTVTAKRPLIERKIDRTVINVEAFISNAGANAFEVLEKSPGVQVDNNENIGMNGKASVLVFIDDKPTYLSGAELANYLKSIPASSLDRIELMTNPPAKYDAAGNAGIINIRTKKNKVKGFNGSVSVSYAQGAYPKTNNSVNFNYRSNNINLFGTTSFSAAHVFTDLDIERRIRNNDQTLKSVFAQNSFIRRFNRSNALKLGLDYYISKKSTLGVVVNGMINPSWNKTFNTSKLTNAHDILDSTITADNRTKSRFRNGSVNLNFRRQIDSLGKELTMDLDFIRYNFNSSQFNRNTVYQPNNTISSADDLIGDLPSDISIYSYKVDYVHPLRKGARAEAGIKSSVTQTDNIADYSRTVNNVTTPDYEITNHFRYTESINAGYVNFSQEFNRFSMQAGLRLENTVSKGHQLGNIVKPDSSFKRTYTNLFPTVFVSYKFDSAARHQLTLSYGKRINRPYYRDLNPFVSQLDKFTFYVGNPFLQPQISNNIELSYIFNNKITLTAFANFISKEINETIELIGTTYYSRPGNLNKKVESGVTLNGTFKPAKWWTSVPNIAYIHLSVKSPLYTQQINTSGGFWDLSATNQFALSKTWSAELNGGYRSLITNGQFQLKAQWQMSAGVQKKVLKNKGSVKLNIRDMFYTRINYGVIRNLQNGEGKWRNAGDSRVVTLAFSYNFGKTTGNRKRHDSGGAQSEQNRVN